MTRTSYPPDLSLLNDPGAVADARKALRPYMVHVVAELEERQREMTERGEDFREGHEGQEAPDTSAGL